MWETRIVFVVLLVAALLSFGGGLTALLQLDAIRSGAYDPVRDDRMDPEKAVALPTRLKRIAAACFAVGLINLFALQRIFKRIEKSP